MEFQAAEAVSTATIVTWRSGDIHGNFPPPWGVKLGSNCCPRKVGRIIIIVYQYRIPEVWGIGIPVPLGICGKSHWGLPPRGPTAPKKTFFCIKNYVFFYRNIMKNIVCKKMCLKKCVTFPGGVFPEGFPASFLAKSADQWISLIHFIKFVNLSSWLQ